MGIGYKICKTKTGKTKKEIVKGVKKVCYKKEGTSKMYVKSKGKFMSLTRYKRMKSKVSKVSGGSSVPSLIGGKKKRKKNKKRRTRGGEAGAGLLDMFKGGKKRR